MEQSVSPHILRGASNSSRMGWLRNISLDFTHKPRISPSESCTFFPGLDPRTTKVDNYKKKKENIICGVVIGVVIVDFYCREAANPQKKIS